MKMINKMLHQSADALFIIQINFLDHNLALLSFTQYDQHLQNVKKLTFFYMSKVSVQVHFLTLIPALPLLSEHWPNPNQCPIYVFLHLP